MSYKNKYQMEIASLLKKRFTIKKVLSKIDGEVEKIQNEYSKTYENYVLCCSFLMQTIYEECFCEPLLSFLVYEIVEATYLLYTAEEYYGGRVKKLSRQAKNYLAREKSVVSDIVDFFKRHNVR